MQRFARFVEELLVTAHRLVAGQLIRPGADLAVQRQVGGVHLRVRPVPQRPDEDPPEGVIVQPEVQVGMPRGELDDRSGLRGAPRVGARPDLLWLRRPGVRKVPVEVGVVVRQEVRIGDVLAVEVCNQAFGIDLVKGSGVV